MSGWIADYRQELESDIWIMPPLYHRVWQWIKYSANHASAKIPNRDGTFTELKAGQHATSLRHIAKGVGYYEGRKWKEPNPKTIKVILDWLENQKMISVCGNTLGTIITVVNWDVYQLEKIKGNTLETLDGLPSNTSVTLGKHLVDTNNKNKKELKRIKNDNNDKQYSDNPKLDKAIKEFIDCRKKSKKPMTDRAVELLIDRLNKFTLDADAQVEMINEAIVRGWQTVYEPKENKSETSNPFLKIMREEQMG